MKGEDLTVLEQTTQLRGYPHNLIEINLNNLCDRIVSFFKSIHKKFQDFFFFCYQ